MLMLRTTILQRLVASDDISKSSTNSEAAASLIIKVRGIKFSAIPYYPSIITAVLETKKRRASAICENRIRFYGSNKGIMVGNGGINNHEHSGSEGL